LTEQVVLKEKKSPVNSRSSSDVLEFLREAYHIILEKEAGRGRRG